jgi:SAM-dependent methyltransferase
MRYQRDIKPFLKSRSRVLEVGCASGTLLSVLREAGHEVFGVDLSSRFAYMAKRLYGIDVVVGDFASMTWPTSQIDAVLLLGTISNLQNLPFALDCIRAMLKPNGILIFNYPDASSFVAKLYGDQFWMFAPSVMSFMTVAGCCDVLSKHGFHVGRARYDVQRPSLGKLMRHAKLNYVLSIFPQKWLSSPLPLAIPVPGVRLVLAQKC